MKTTIGRKTIKRERHPQVKRNLKRTKTMTNREGTHRDRSEYLYVVEGFVL
jgi:hypothetical protein